MGEIKDEAYEEELLDYEAEDEKVPDSAGNKVNGESGNKGNQRIRITKPRNDKRDYRRIVLCNPLQVLLISDLDTDKRDISSHRLLLVQVVGWPLIRSFRKNSLQLKKVEYGCGNGMFVKVSMVGAPYLRKINLKIYKRYSPKEQILEKKLSLKNLIQSKFVQGYACVYLVESTLIFCMEFPLLGPKREGAYKENGISIENVSFLSTIPTIWFSIIRFIFFTAISIGKIVFDDIKGMDISKVIGEESIQRINHNRNSYHKSTRRKPFGEIHLTVK